MEGYGEFFVNEFKLNLSNLAKDLSKESEELKEILDSEKIITIRSVHNKLISNIIIN
jgi:hypothetical protein